MITQSIEIQRPPQEVFAYLDQPERHAEWQTALVSSEVETPGPVGVGTRVRQKRRVGKREQDTSYEITEHDPPRRSTFRGLAGPVRPNGVVTVEPAGDGSTSRVTIELDIVGHGLLGKLIGPLARRQAAKEVPQDQQRLKERLESGAV